MGYYEQYLQKKNSLSNTGSGVVSGGNDAYQQYLQKKQQTITYKPTTAPTVAPVISNQPVVSKPSISTPTNIFQIAKGAVAKASSLLPKKVQPAMPVLSNGLKVSLTQPKEIKTMDLGGTNTSGSSGQLSTKIEAEPKTQKFNLLKSVTDNLVSAFPGTAEKIQSITAKPNIKNAPKAFISTIQDAIVEESRRISQTTLDRSVPRTERLGQAVQNITGGVGVVFSPIGGLFVAGEDVPVLSPIARGLSALFIFASESATRDSNMLVDKLPISAKAKQDLKPAVGEVFSLATQIAMGKIMAIGSNKAKSVIAKVGEETFTKLTKATINDFNLPKDISISSDVVGDFLTGRKPVNPDIAKALTVLNIKERKSAWVQGVDMTIPAEEIIKIIDKPYWSKVKSIFKVKPTEEIYKIPQGQATIKPFQLESGEYTPSEIRNKIISTPLEKTVDGKELIKTSLIAEKQGQNVLISKGEPTIEQGIEKAGGWRPGDKAKFDTALYEKNASVVKSMLPTIPEEYKTRFATEIKNLVGKEPTTTKGVTIPKEVGIDLSKAVDTKEFGFQGQGLKEVTTALRLNDIPRRSITTPEYRDYDVNLKPGRQVTKPIIATVQDISDPNCPIEIVDGWHRWRQAVANKDETIPVKYIFKPNQATKGVGEVKEVPKVEVEPKTPSKIAKSIETKAIEQKLTEGFEGIAGYDKIIIKKQAELASKLMQDIELAKKVIRGVEPLPEGLRGTALITAAEEYIKETGDSKLAYELANSPLVSETSAAAQELRLAAEREPDSVTKQFQELKKAREEAVKKKTGKEVKQAVKDEVAKIKKQIKAPTMSEWANFLELIKCK